jgi:hypothetical protein
MDELNKVTNSYYKDLNKYINKLKLKSKDLYRDAIKIKLIRGLTIPTLLKGRSLFYKTYFLNLYSKD